MEAGRSSQTHLQQWIEDTDIDGFNLAYILAHQSFIDVVDYIVPELQKRGVYKTEYREGTLREKLFGNSAHLPNNHKGASYRYNHSIQFSHAV